MKISKNPITRRTFLKQGAGATVTAGFLLNTDFLQAIPENKKVRVVLVRRANLFSQAGKLRKNVVGEMIDEGIRSLFDLDIALSGWGKICTEEDYVGIKTNVSNPPTPSEVNDVIQQRVIEAGVPRDHLSVNDRGVRNDKIFRKASVLINVRPLRTHHWSGVGSLIKNYIMFVPKPYEYHDDGCADLGAIWNLPAVKGKTRLNVLIMFEPLFHGIGPHHFNPKYTWRYNGLLLGQDPVAVDTVGLSILLAKRKLYFQEEKPLIPSPKHIQYAHSRHGVGNADWDKIEVLKKGWDENTLI